MDDKKLINVAVFEKLEKNQVQKYMALSCGSYTCSDFQAKQRQDEALYPNPYIDHGITFNINNNPFITPAFSSFNACSLAYKVYDELATYDPHKLPVNQMMYAAKDCLDPRSDQVNINKGTYISTYLPNTNTRWYDALINLHKQATKDIVQNECRNLLGKYVNYVGG